ncbi:MAG: outer membrane beta-barrel protein [Sphingobium sp.]|uniref:outer membrane beta-barrel protein n=1 Tax=Sphingobium sp. TaxID=1912891 RepID=UPI0029A43310|nr:outer membrane beta-barrel protein [Sphingobium sp.]MDX3909607.1 outer membrane beta-barrel protein [Sphingobium sp.]
MCSSHAVAQRIERDTSIEDLPRPGYEPRTIRAGSFVLMPKIEAGARFDNNILAAQDNKRSDVVFLIDPSIDARLNSANSKFRGRAYAGLSRYGRTKRENTTEFGGLLDYRHLLGKRQSIATILSFDRTFERRSDPEAEFARSRRPSLINVATAELEYRYDGPRVGVTANVAATKLNYLPVQDADRDMVTYRASIRGQVRLSERIAVFVQPYVNRRDPRLRIDRTGVDRQSTTYGALGGVSLALGDRLRGDMGVGFFHSDPGDLGLEAFNGVAASGRLTWRPRTRTAVSVDVFRGDVATVRAGAIGRVDSRFNLNIDQEARHNLILRGSVGLRHIQYRGDFDQNQRYAVAEASARYLLNRHVWVEATGNYSQRTTPDNFNEFRRWQGFLKIGLVY